MTHSALLLVAAVALSALLVTRSFVTGRHWWQVHRGIREGKASLHSDITVIAAYHNRFAAPSAAEAIDDRTWEDLNLDEVFFSLDHTASEPGRQYLYHLLRRPHFAVEPLARLDRAARHFAANDADSAAVRGLLTRLSDEGAAYLAPLFFGDLPARPLLWWLFPVLTVSAVACLGLLTTWPRMGLVWVGICAVNILLQVFYKSRLQRFTPALHELPAFLRVARSLGDMELAALADETRVLRDGAKQLGALRRATSWLMFEAGQTNELAAGIYEYINLLLLLDINAFVFTAETLRRSRHLTRAMFEAIGYVDAAQSLAAWRRTLPHWAEPEFVTPQKELHVKGLVHPLLSSAVPNSLDIKGTGVLITGSNMSGKTTFIRALGVNAVLAQTLHTACAESWRAPMLRVRTTIGRADNLIEGKSYYLAEAESVLALVRATETGHQHLFLLDEIFRGTNTTERVAAGYAVLAYLNRGLHLAVVATHDLELVNLLRERYAVHHFREQITGDNLTFDYLLQSGPSSTRNAIALLRLMHYPESLVADALAHVDWTHRQESGASVGDRPPRSGA